MVERCPPVLASFETSRESHAGRTHVPSPLACASLPLSGIAILSILFMLAALILFLFNPSDYHFYPVCPLHKTTGLSCPGCGGLRAVHQLLHGHIAEAFCLNPLFVGLLPVGTILAVRWVTARVRKRPAPSFHPFWTWGCLALVIVFGIVRNLPIPCLAFLAQ
jgi:hypothetical protein